MSLDNIQLNNKVVVDLYKKSLISLEIHQPTNEKKGTTGLNFLGENLKNILILVNMEGHKYLAENDLDFLSKILAACKLTIADVAIVNIFQNNLIDYDSLLAQFNPIKIIFFKVDPKELGFPLMFPLYKPQTYHSQTYLTADALAELQQNIELKKTFWNALKQIF